MRSIAGQMQPVVQLRCAEQVLRQTGLGQPGAACKRGRDCGAWQRAPVRRMQRFGGATAVRGLAPPKTWRWTTGLPERWRTTKAPPRGRRSTASGQQTWRPRPTRPPRRSQTRAEPPARCAAQWRAACAEWPAAKLCRQGPYLLKLAYTVAEHGIDQGAYQSVRAARGQHRPRRGHARNKAIHIVRGIPGRDSAHCVSWEQECGQHWQLRRLQAHELQLGVPVLVQAHLAAASRTAALRSGPSATWKGQVSLPCTARCQNVLLKCSTC